MPIFEYRCKKCQKISEHYIKGSDEAGLMCRSCGAGELERVAFSRFAVGSSSSGPACSFGGECSPAPECGGCCPGCKTNG